MRRLAAFNGELRVEPCVERVRPEACFAAGGDLNPQMQLQLAPARRQVIRVILVLQRLKGHNNSAIYDGLLLIFTRIVCLVEEEMSCGLPVSNFYQRGVDGIKSGIISATMLMLRRCPR